MIGLPNLLEITMSSTISHRLCAGLLALFYVTYSGLTFAGSRSENQKLNNVMAEY